VVQLRDLESVDRHRNNVHRHPIPESKPPEYIRAERKVAIVTGLDKVDDCEAEIKLIFKSTAASDC